MTAISVADMGQTPPQAGVTVTGAATSFDVQASADGGKTWQTVVGGKSLPSPDAFVRDYFPALNIPIRYRVLESNGTITLAAATITFASSVGWLQDPLVPKNAVALAEGWPDAEGHTMLTWGTEAEASYEQSGEVIQTFGARRPVVSAGQRQVASAVPLTFAHDVAVEDGVLKELLLSTGVLVYRSPEARLLDPVAFIKLDAVKESRPNAGATVAIWNGTATQGRPTNLKLVIPWHVYTDVAAAWNTPSSMTYTAVIAARGPDTYLGWEANPLTGS